MGDVVDLGSGEDHSPVEVDDDASQMESAIENVAQAVCNLWEVTGSDVDASVVTDVDGRFVRISVVVELV